MRGNRREDGNRKLWKKRSTAVLTAAALLMGTGVCAPVEARAEDQTEDAAMGRYLEEDIALPDNCGNIERIQCLEDGTLRVIYYNEEGQLFYADSPDAGQSWEAPVLVAELMGLEPEDVSLSFPALSPDGGIFVNARQKGEDSEEWDMTCYYADGQGKITKMDLKELGDFLYEGMVTDRGTLLLNALANGLAEVSLEDGSILHRFEEGSAVDYYTCIGNTIIMCSQGKILCYDLESGDPLEVPAPLEEQISSDEKNLYIQGVGYYPVVFARGDEEDSFFYADSRGMYRYAFGGSVVEQIMDGSLNSLSSPSVMFTDLKMDGEGRFYLAVLDTESSPSARILRYEYSADTPTVPDTELKIYSLTDNDFIRQAAALFQKKYPDIYITMETGMSGEDAVTAADALRTLNTEIMADKGPDILMMDGIPAETYIEEGLLTDISGLLKEVDETEGLLPNIYDAYKQEDGSVYEMPVKFAIPMLQGHQEDVEKIVDLKTLADMVEAHEGDYSVNTLPFFYCYGSRLLLTGLSGTSSAVWLKEDGTLDEDAVGEYLTQAGRIYQCTESARSEMEEKAGADFQENLRYMELEVLDTTVATSSLSLLEGSSLLGMGGLHSDQDLSMVYSAELADPSLTTRLWDGQAKNIFFPKQLVGISARSREQEAAELFVKYVLGSEGQALGSSFGLPVNCAAYDSGECWKEGSPDDLAGSVSTSNRETGKEISMDVHYPSRESIENAKALGKAVTVPAASNNIILNAVVDAGSRYLEGELSLEDALSEIGREVNLYLSE